MMEGFGNFIKQFEKIRKDLGQITVRGESGTGMVKVTINGRREVEKVEIEKQLLQEDKRMLEDLVAAAVNDALRRLDRSLKDKLGALTGGLMPSRDNMPF